MNNLLLNPGPTNTRPEVKVAQYNGSDVCHRTDEFASILQETKSKLLKRFSLDANESDWNVSILGGSGTTAMEAFISSLMDEVVVINAGNYGQRAIDIMETYNVKHSEVRCQNIDEVPANKNFKNIYFVENETTTGEKFDIGRMAQIFPQAKFFIDATSAFGASDYSSVTGKINGISFCANKCLQSTPGLGIVIWRKKLELFSRTYYTDLNKYVEDLPFTIPVQSIYALHTALDIGDAKSTFDSRSKILIEDLNKIGIKCVNRYPSNSIIGFKHPNKTCEKLKKFLSKRGLVIYSGIPGIKNSFRVSTMSVKFDDDYGIIIEALRDSCIC